ncbi:MAG: HD domain-containing protein [Ginsengibacter sp.]
MPIKDHYNTIESNILLKLRKGLSKDLTYHTVQHTLDILKNAERIAHQENIHNENDLDLLKVACLYHDSGFLFSYKGHEEESCKLAKKELPGFNITPNEIEVICGLIMATKIPQTPHNKLEEIICDADLDYLGTKDFSRISDTLFQELKKRKMVTTKREWDTIQVSFLKKHHYFTETSKKLREKQKLIHLKAIEAML